MRMPREGFYQPEKGAATPPPPPPRKGHPTHEAPPEQGLESDCAPAGTTPDRNGSTMHEITGLVQVCMECGRVFVGQRQGLGLPCGHGYGVVGAVEDLGKALAVYRAAIAVASSDTSGVEESDWPELDNLIEQVRG